jgi:hypothetical protein
MDNTAIGEEERVKLEHSTLIEEYKAVRAEIILTLESARQVVHLTLIAAGALLAVGPSLVDAHMPIIFLIVPFLFYILAWMHLRHIFYVRSLGDHLRQVVLPRIRLILSGFPDERRDAHSVLSWEDEWEGLLRRYRLLILPIAGADYGAPLLAAAASLCVYLALVTNSSQAIPVIDGVLVGANALAFAYSIYWGFRAELRPLDR